MGPRGEVGSQPGRSADAEGGRPGSGARSSYLRLLATYPFGLLWASQAVSEFGSSFTRMALFLLAARFGERPGGPATATALSVIMAAQMLPPLFLGPFGGPLVDRSDRKRLMVWVDLARAGLAATLALHLSLWGVAGIVLLHSTLTALFGPARSSIFPEIVRREDLMTATSLWQLTYQGLGLLGPAVAGVTVATLGLGSAFIIDALSFLASALTLLSLRLPRLGQGKSDRSLRSYLADLGQGLRYASREPRVRFFVLGLFLIVLVGGIFNVQAVVYALNVAGLSESQFGLVSAANGVGAIAAAFLVGHFGRRARKEWLFVAMVGLLGLTLGFYALRPGFWGLGLLALLDNGFCVAALIPAQTSLYETVDRDLRGRTFALFGAAMAAAPLPGYFLAGTLAARVAPTTVIAWCGLVVVAEAAVMAAGLARAGARGAPIEQKEAPGS